MSKHSLTKPHAKKIASEKKFQRNAKKIQDGLDAAKALVGSADLKRVDEVKPEVPLDTSTPEVVSSHQSPATPPVTKEQNMDITLTLNTKPRKSTRIVIYESPLNSVQFLRTAFGATLPETLVLSGEGFAEPKAPKAAKIVETKEERKARLAARPKKTLAEKVAAAEARTAALKAKLAKAAPAGM